MADELKPCPFCGGPVKLEKAHQRRHEQLGMRQFWGVVCRNTTNIGGTCCMEQVPSASAEAATERWNRRAAPSSPVADDRLSKLPEPTVFKAHGTIYGYEVRAYTADQVRRVQREAYEAGAVAALKIAGTRMDTGFEGGAHAPIALQPAAPQPPKEHR